MRERGDGATARNVVQSTFAPLDIRQNWERGSGDEREEEGWK